MPCETPKTIDISHETQHSSAGNSQSCSSTAGFRKEGEHVGIAQCVWPEGYAPIDHAPTTEPGLNPVSRNDNSVITLMHANHANKIVIRAGICQDTDSTATMVHDDLTLVKQTQPLSAGLDPFEI